MFVFAASDKGGTGRSVTSSNLLYRSALQGNDVCYLDFDFGSPTAETLTNNTITGLTIAGSSTGTAHILGGLYTNTVATAVKAISVCKFKPGMKDGAAAPTWTRVDYVWSL